MVWDGCSESGSNLLESLQIEGTRVVTGALKGTNRVSLLKELSWVDLSVRRKLHKLNLMYKIVFKLAPPYLCDLCPEFVSDRSCYSLRSANNLCLPYVRTDRHKKLFLFSSIKWWNSLPLVIRISSSLVIFKNSLLKFLQFPSRNYLFYTGGRSASISHTRLRLNFSALKLHLFRKNCCSSPASTLCDAPVEDPKHYFLYCCNKYCLNKKKRKEGDTSSAIPSADSNSPFVEFSTFNLLFRSISIPSGVCFMFRSRPVRKILA